MIVADRAPIADPLAAASGQAAIAHLSATDLFDVAERARRGGRLDDAITIYDALARDPDAEVRAEARFRKGLMLADARRYNDAAVAFRALLDEKPDALRVRLELARVLALAGEEQAARRELRQALAAGLPDDVAATVQQFTRALRSTRPFGGSIDIAFAPDTNVNRATQQRTLDTVVAPLTLSRDARARSGVGLQMSGQGYVRVPIGNHLALLPRASALGNFYRASAFNDVSASALLGLEWRSGSDRLTPSFGETWRWYGDRPYASTTTATVNWLHPIGASDQLLVGASAGRAHYRRNDLQDGGLYSASINLEHAFDSRSGASVTMNAVRQAARDPGFATWSGGGSVLGWREWRRSTYFASIGIHRLGSDAALFLFREPRREWLVDAQAGVTIRSIQVRGFAPMIRLSYERNRSTVGLYRYRRLSGTLGITRAF